jgi:hypothetical protein
VRMSGCPHEFGAIMNPRCAQIGGECLAYILRRFMHISD